MASSQFNKILSLEQISKLPHEELVSQLLEAQKRIQELEAIYNDNSRSCSTLNKDVSSHPIDEKSTDSSLVYSADNSKNSIFNNVHANPKEIMDELEWKLKKGNIGKHETFQHHDKSDFVVAYEYKGDFPSCDEDLSVSSLSLQEKEGSMAHPEIIIYNDGMWDDDDNDNNNDDIDQQESFSLIPSPVINSPPYEYIFLTKANEAKCRIFLNQKLNKVFQEEIQKLQKREAEFLKGKSHYVLEDSSDHDDENQEEGKVKHRAQLDLHNQNHLVNSPSVSSGLSNTSVIHCFDPSDVDLELKKIFMEKPPVTHKIVRRKSRRERGSSVPAVDSYYGTGDLSKVGHASWFIPILTESERKAIGWKHEYHYGHWKYAALNVPNVKVNQISLHPHMELDDAIQSKYNNNHPHFKSGMLHQNPLHHREIDLTEPFVTEKEEDSLPTSQQTQCSTCANRHHNHEGNGVEDTLSFLTLSGCSTEASQSCHIIPDKSTLKRILRYILPCIKSNGSSVDTADLNGENSTGDHFNLSGNASKSKKHHEIETLVEPSGKLNFPISHTYISLEASIDEQVGEHDNDSVSTYLSTETNKEGPKEHNNESHHSHHHHHQQHGIFHWKKILSSHHDDSSKSVESMSVVGGDVIASTHEFGGEGTEADGMKKQPKCNSSVHSETGCMKVNYVTGTVDSFHTSSTESDDSEEDNTSENRSAKRKGFRKLKSCKAFTKLLTLKDLGYETDEVDDKAQGNRSVKTSSKLGANYVTLFGEAGSVAIQNEGLGKHHKESSFNIEKDPIKIQGNRNKEELSRTNRSITDMNTPRGSNNLSSGSSGFPFSSLSISHQNSEIGPNFQDEIPSFSVSQTEQQTNGIETRFLDPKDLLIPQMSTAQNESVDEDTLPFVFDFNNSQEEANNVNLVDDYGNGEQQDENVIEWMGEGFADDIEEGLGLLNSCLQMLLKYNKPANENGGDDSLKLDQLDVGSEADNEDAPEKVVGQHCITTLNDLNDQGDAVNKNDDDTDDNDDIVHL